MLAKPESQLGGSSTNPMQSSGAKCVFNVGACYAVDAFGGNLPQLFNCRFRLPCLGNSGIQGDIASPNN